MLQYTILYYISVSYFL